MSSSTKSKLCAKENRERKFYKSWYNEAMELVLDLYSTAYFKKGIRKKTKNGPMLYHKQYTYKSCGSALQYVSSFWQGAGKAKGTEGNNNCSYL